MNKYFIFILMFLSLPLASATDWTDYMNAYYSFQGTGVDSSPLGLNNATGYSVGYTSNGIIGNASVFNISSLSHYNISSSVGLDNLDEITINYFVKMTSLGTDQRLVHYNTVYSTLYGTSDKSLRYRQYNTSTSYELSSTANRLGLNWAMVTVTYKTGNMSIYINGTLSTSYATLVGKMPDVSTPIVLGLDEDMASYPFNGTMDELMFLNKSLTATEVTDLYTTYLSGHTPLEDCFAPSNNSINNLVANTTLCNANYYNASFNVNATNVVFDMNGARINYPNMNPWKNYSIDNVRAGTQKDGFIIKNGFLNGSGNSLSGTGFAIFNGDNNQVQNMTITNFEVNVQLNGAGGNSASGFILNNSNLSWSRGCLANFQVYNGQFMAYNSHFDDSTNISSCFQSPHGAYLDSTATNKLVANSSFINCSFDRNTASGYHTNGPSAVAIYGVRNVSVIGGQALNNGRKGYDLQGCLECLIENSTCGFSGNNCIDIRSTEYGIPYFTTNSTFKNIRFYNNTFTDIGYYNGLGLVFNNMSFDVGSTSPRNLYMYASNNQQFNFTSNSRFNISYENVHTYSPSASFYKNYLTPVNLNITGNNISIVNQASQYPNDDVYNLSTSSVLYPNIDNQTVTLRSSQYVALGDYASGGGAGTSFSVNAPVSGSSVANSILLNWSSYISQNTYVNTQGAISTISGSESLGSVIGFKAKTNITFYGFAFTVQPNDGSQTGTIAFYINGVLNYTVPSTTYNALGFYNITIPEVNLVSGDYVKISGQTGERLFARFSNGAYSSNPYIESSTIDKYVLWDGGGGTHYIKFNSTALTNRYEVFLVNGTTIRGLQNVPIPTTTSQNNTYQLNISLYPLNLSTVPFYYFMINASDNSLSNVAYNMSGTFNLSYNARINISAVNYTGGTVSTFNIVVTDLTTSFSSNHSTTTGSIIFDSILGNSYSIFATSPTLANQTYLITANATLQNLTYTAFPFNSLNVSSFDDATGNPISINASLYFVGGSNSFTNLLNGSSSIFSSIPLDAYSVTVTASGYVTRSYIVSVSNGSTQSLNIYMLPINESVPIGFYTRTVYDDIIEGATIVVSKIIGSSSVSISQAVTDATGYASFELEEGSQYSFIIYANGFQVYSANLVPYSTNSPYYFKLNPSSTFTVKTINDFAQYNYYPSDSSLNYTNVSLSFSTFSANGSITYTYMTCNGLTQNVTGSPTGSTINFTLNLSGGDRIMCQRSFYVNGYGLYSFNTSYYLYDEYAYSIKQSADYVKNNTRDVWLTLLSYVVMLLIAIGIKQKYPDTRITGAILTMGTIFFVAIGWINWVAGGVSATIGLLILYMGSR